MPLLTRWTLNAAYLVALCLASPAIAWGAWRGGKYREGFAAKLLGRVPRRAGDRPCVWLHAVSVGEVNLLGVLIEEMGRRRPEWEVVVSTTTKTGYDLAQRRYGDRLSVFYSPLDFSWAVDAATRRIRPDLLVLAELELWPNLIAAAKSRGVRVAIVNGRLSERSYNGYRRVGGLVRRTLESIDLIAAQDAATRERFVGLGARSAATVTTGSLKYDGAQTDRDNPRTRELRRLAGIAAGETVWLAGSTQSPEEAVCVRIFKELSEDYPGLRLLLVPRHPERFAEVAKLLEESGVPWRRRTELGDSPPPCPPLPPCSSIRSASCPLGGAWRTSGSWAAASVVAAART